ncbi:MAG TPA: ABC transporter permease [Candidatus Levybacteria bacterium]|nr:ABC transporter permease [Candidatus Levybacteria bacterium]
MDYKELIHTSIQALKSNLLRTSLTMTGIIIGISSVILIVSIGQGAVAFVTKELSSFGTDYFQITPGGDTFSSFTGVNTLTMDDMEAIQKDTSLTNVKAVVPNAVTTTLVTANDEKDSLMIYGTTSEVFAILNPDILYGDFLSEENDSGAERIAVLGVDVAEKFFGEDTDPVGERIRIKNIPFQVIGVVESSSALAGGILNNVVYVPINVVFNEIAGQEYIQEIDVSVHDTDQINQTIEDVTALLREEHNLEEGDEDDFQIQSAQDILGTVQTITSLLTAMIAGISGISLVVGGVGVMNIMLVSVTERTREIGLLKAIGAKEKDILMQFLIEAVIMTLSGGVVGIVIGISGAYLISLVAGIPFVISIPAVLIAVGVSTLVGVAFGLYPARRAARLSPIDALRYE